MATNVTTSLDTIASQFADVIRDVPAVEQLWLVENSESIAFIAITSHTDAEAERRITNVFDDLIAQYPTAAIHLRLIGPGFFVEGTDIESLLSRHARQIPLQSELRPPSQEHCKSTHVPTSPETIARQYADAIRDDPAVEQLWMVSDQESIEVIAIISDADAETERRIFGVFGDLLARNPTAAVFPRLLNPRFFVEGTDMVSLLPRRARQIPLRD